MVDRLRPHAANALTAARAVLAPVFVVAVVRAPSLPAYGWAAVAIYAVAVLTDVWDGRVARRVGSANATGRAFDHFTDIGFILTALGADVAVGLVPWWVPASIATSFLFYVVDSWSRPLARSGLVGSRVGHAAGVLNYALIGVVVTDRSTGLALLPDAMLHGLFCLVPVYSALAIATRLVAAPGRPASALGR